MDLRTHTDESVCAGEVTPGTTESARVGVWARLTRPARPPLSPGLLPPDAFPQQPDLMREPRVLARHSVSYHGFNISLRHFSSCEVKHHLPFPSLPAAIPFQE